jgi:NADPH-dependent glutamate synthase beta subunit-like oxidoreductase
MKRFKPVVDADGKASTGTVAGAPVFAGGDLVNDRKDAISAIADGHRAALGIDRLLGGKGA